MISKKYIPCCIICLFVMIFTTGCGDKVVDGIPCEHNVEGFYYNDKNYFCESGLFIADVDKKYMGKSEECYSSVYFVGDENNPDIVIVAGSDNTRAYKEENYNINTDGKITKVLIDPNYRDPNPTILYKDEDIDMVNKLISITGETEKYEMNNYYTQGNDFYFEYDDCLVATRETKGGYIAKINNKWIFVNVENLNKITRQDINEISFSIEGVEIHDADIISWIEKSDISKGIS